MRVDQIDTSEYPSLLKAKETDTLNLFQSLSLPANTALVASPPQHYRLRAEFRVWHQDDDSFYIMFDPATKEKFRVDYFIPGSALLNKLMQSVRTCFLDNELLRRKLYQVDFLTTLSGEGLISLIYHKRLEEDWLEEAKALKQKLSEIAPVNIIGRSRKQKVLVDKDYVTETLQVDGQSYHYQQIENSFTQPNGIINQAMLEWANRIAKPLSGDLLELYCGNGNFSIALAKQFNQVLATEIARSSVKSAQYNLALNKVNNTIIGQSSAEDFSAAYFEGKSVKSLKTINLTDYQFSTILVDPPRAGLDQQTVELVKKFDNIIYISCNPETLANNLQDIEQTHQIRDLTLFDQFPYTHHIETGVWLTRR